MSTKPLVFRQSRWGGLNLQGDPHELNPFEATDIRNIFLEGNFWRTRGGTAVHNSTAIATAKVTGLFRYYPIGKPPWLLAAAGNRLVRSEDDSATFALPAGVIPKYAEGTVTSDGSTTIDFSDTVLTKNVDVGDKICVGSSPTVYSITELIDDSEDFTTDPSWTTVHGTWAATGGIYKQTETTWNRYKVYSDIDFTTGRISVQCRSDSDAGSPYSPCFGVYAKYIDANNYIWVRIGQYNQINVGWQEGGSGSDTNISSFTVTEDQWYEVVITVDGDDLTVEIDGVQYGSTITTALGGTPGYVGFYTENPTSYDNLSVDRNGDKSAVVDSAVPAGSDQTYVIFQDWAEGDFYFDVFQDHVMIASKGDKPRRFDGTVMTELGYRKGDVPTVAASSVAGVLDGTYRYAISYLYELGEGDIGLPTDAVLLSNKRAIVTVPIGDQRCIGRNIWRATYDTATSLWGDYALVDTINDNSGTTYTDNTTDEDRYSDSYYTDHENPDEATFITKTGNRVFYTRGSNIYYSAWGEPDNFPPENRIQVSSDDGEEITGWAVFGGDLFVWKETSIWRIPTSYGVYAAINVDNRVGCAAPRSVVHLLGGVAFVGKYGVYFFDGHAPRLISRDITPLFHDDSSENRRINPLWVSKIAGCLYQNRWLLMAYPSDISQENDKVLVLDTWQVDIGTGRGTWAIWDTIAASMWSVWDGSGDGGELFYGHTSDGKVYQADHLNTDSGSGITAYWESGWEDFGNPHLIKHLRGTASDFRTKAGALAISCEFDHSTALTATNTNTVAASVTWDDTLKWGPTAASGSGLSWTDPTDRHDYFSWGQLAEGRRGKYKIEYSGSEPFRIHSLLFDYETRTPRRS